MKFPEPMLIGWETAAYEINDIHDWLEECIKDFPDPDTGYDKSLERYDYEIWFRKWFCRFGIHSVVCPDIPPNCDTCRYKENRE